ncbi:MAG: ATP-grasp domain-containing protein [Candidatus Heimdallarchaeota archaeon]|nr:ATP-grasp domain-containing protein [Candidatus Heimdallarchaeota archaeon]
MTKILIVDYIVGGGFAEEDLPLERLAEGYAILRSCIQQFAHLGYKIATLIDHRLMQYIRISPIHDFISVATHEDFVNGIKSFAETCDYTLTLAPESKGTLQDLATIMVNAPSIYLGSKPESIELAADKLKTMNLAKELDMNVPATFSPNCNESFDKIVAEVSVLGFPLIVKPIDGIGCQGLTKVSTIDDLRYGLQSANSVSGLDNCIVQEFITGTPVSTSLLVNGETVFPLSINHQNLRMDSNKSTGNYIGGSVPYDIPEYNDEIIAISTELVGHMDLKGFVGVDLIVSDEGIFVIEVNPRITIPFIALNNLASENLAGELISIVEKGSIEKQLKLNGYATFSKLLVPYETNKIAKFEKVTAFDGVLSPPFPIGSNKHSYALLMGMGSTNELARKDFQRIKNEVLSNLS